MGRTSIKMDDVIMDRGMFHDSEPYGDKGDFKTFGNRDRRVIK
jgi:hypothetical protein